MHRKKTSREKNYWFSVIKRLFIPGLFVLVFFFCTQVFAANYITTASLTAAYKNYVSYGSTLAIYQQNPTPIVTSTPPPEPLLSQNSSPVVYSDTALASALQNLLNNPSIAAKLRGPRGPAGPQGPAGTSSGVSAGSGNNAMYGSQPVANLQPSAPNPIPAVFIPVGTSQPDPAHNFSAGATYFTAANISGNTLTAGTANLTTLNSTSLNVTGNISGGSITGILNPGLTLGSIPFQEATGLAQDNANLFYDPVNHILGLGTNSPNTTSVLDLTSTSKGFLAPRMTTGQRDAIVSPATGLMIYNTTDNAVNIYNGTIWGAVGGGGASNVFSRPGGVPIAGTITTDNTTTTVTGVGTHFTTDLVNGEDVTLSSEAGTFQVFITNDTTLDLNPMPTVNSSSATIIPVVTRSVTINGIGQIESTDNKLWTTGFFGVGTASPGTQLHVLAPGQASANEPVDVVTVEVGAPISGTKLGYGPSILFKDALSSDVSNMARISAVYEPLGGQYGGALAFSTNSNTNNNNAFPVERMRISNSGNVGIGTTSPGATLDVLSTATTGNVVNITDTALTTGSSLFVTGSNASPGTQSLGGLFPSVGTLALTGNVGNNVTIGADARNGAAALFLSKAILNSSTVFASSYNSLLLTTVNNTTNPNSNWGLYSYMNDATDLDNSLYGIDVEVDSTGNAAKTIRNLISTPSSSSNVADTIYGGIFQTLEQGAVTTGIQNSYGVQAMVNTININGGTANAYAGYFQGSGSVTSGTINTYGLYVANGEVSTAGTSTNIGLYVEPITGADTNYAAIFAGGNVGIGVTNPAVTLTVFGDIRTGTSGTNGCVQNFAGTAIAGVCSSDANLKTVVNNITGILDKFTSLDLVTYHWNQTASDVYHNNMDALNTGYIAQQVEQYFPELVTIDSKGYRQLNYTTLSLYGLEAVKEMNLNLDAIAGMTVPTPTTDSTNFAVAFFNNLFSKISSWLGDTTNGVQKICVDGECLTKDDFHSLLLLAHPPTGLITTPPPTTDTTTTPPATTTPDTTTTTPSPAVDTSTTDVPSTAAPTTTTTPPATTPPPSTTP